MRVLYANSIHYSLNMYLNTSHQLDLEQLEVKYLLDTQNSAQNSPYDRNLANVYRW